MKLKVFIIILSVLCVAVYITGLFPDVSIDAAKYAAVSRYMHESGDLIHLKIHGEPYLQKPLLMFWLSAFSFSVFGLSMFAFKLPSLLFSVLGVYSTFRLAKLYYGVSAGKLSAIIFATSQMLFLYTNDLHTDALLTANIIFGTWQVAEYLHNKKLLHLIAGFIGIGLAMITKGPIGLAIPAFAIGGHLIMKRDWPNIFPPEWLIGLPVLIIIIFPTLKGIYDQFGWDGIRFYFLTNNVGRITGEVAGKSKDYFFYFHTLIYIFLPWSLFAFTAFYFHIRQLVHKNKNHRVRPEYFTYSVILIYTFILSISRQKAPHYLFPVIPFLSIVVADFIHKVSNISGLNSVYKWMMGFRIFVIILLWVITGIIIIVVFPTTDIFIWFPVGFMLLLLIYGFTLYKTRKHKLILPLALSAIALNFTINTHFLPSAYKYQGVINASYRFNELASDSDILYTYNYKEFETYFYPKTISERVTDTHHLEKILSQEGTWFFVSPKGYEDLRSLAASRIVYEEKFYNKKMSIFSPAFLNPKTREKELHNVYLLKVK